MLHAGEIQTKLPKKMCFVWVSLNPQGKPLHLNFMQNDGRPVASPEL